MRHHPNGSLKNIMAFSAFSNKVFSTKKMSTCCLSILHDHINRNLNLKSLLEHIPCQYQNLVVCILIFYYCIFIPGLSSHLGKVQLLKWKVSQKSTGKDLKKHDILYSRSNITQLQLQLQLYFYKNIDYNRLACRIAIANRGRPVKEKYSERKGRKLFEVTINDISIIVIIILSIKSTKERWKRNWRSAKKKLVNTFVLKSLLIELFQLLVTSQYSHLLFLRCQKAICEELSQTLL